MTKGLLIVYSGPSGVGKGTILQPLIPDKELKLCFSISMTTRKPRNGEVDGKEYYFVTRERFEKAIENNELLEHAEFVGNYYGTPLEYVEKKRNEGYNVVLEIEIDGAKQVLSKCEDATSIFIAPPSLEELENRIRGRKTEDEETIKKRLAKAKEELKEANNYKYVIVNDTIEESQKMLREIILKEMTK